MAGTNKSPTYAITGIKEGIDGDVLPLRPEVDSWYPPKTEEHIIQVNLFLLALKKLQDMDPTEKLSFFQVAGIHGLPYQPWDENTPAQTPDEGYCTHDSILFPTWHRPYMVLLEQRLYEIMTQEVIPKFPKEFHESFKHAAGRFRFPYWDWAAKKTRSGSSTPKYDLPEIAKEPQIEVLSYDGTTTGFVDNPMHKFTMPGHKPMGSYGVTDVEKVPFSTSIGTSRWALESSTASTQWQEGEVNNDLVTQALNNHPWYNPAEDIVVDNTPLAEMTYRLFLPEYINSYEQFATTKFVASESATSYLNLEFVHNNIHNWVGGMDPYIGHMAVVPVAGFDPIFWMHHANVDRLFAIWQALNVDNPHNWFDKPDEQLPDGGTWSIKPGAIDTPQTPLAPFHTDTNGTTFTSQGIRDWMQLYYSYPELQPWLDKYKKDGIFQQQLYLADIKRQIKLLYSSIDITKVNAPIETKAANNKVEMNDYIIDVKYKRLALGGVPYTVYLFVGEIEQGYNRALYAHRALVGYIYNFSNPIYGDDTSPGCENCRRKASDETYSTGQIPITQALIARVATQDLHSLRKNHVEPYLQKHLHWKIKTIGDHEVPAEQVHEFIKVSVHQGTLENFEDDRELSRCHSHQPLPSVTDGKHGGYTGGANDHW